MDEEEIGAAERLEVDLLRPGVWPERLELEREWPHAARSLRATSASAPAKSLPVLRAGRRAGDRLEERLEELQVVPARAVDARGERALSAAGEVLAQDVQHVREARLQPVLRVEDVALVGERHLHERALERREIGAAQELVERALDAHDLAPRAERDDLDPHRAALDLREHDPLRVGCLAEGVLEERARVADAGRDLLRRVQVPERDVVEPRERRRWHGARAAHRERPLAVG